MYNACFLFNLAPFIVYIMVTCKLIWLGYGSVLETFTAQLNKIIDLHCQNANITQVGACKFF